MGFFWGREESSIFRFCSNLGSVVNFESFCLILISFEGKEGKEGRISEFLGVDFI